MSEVAVINSHPIPNPLADRFASSRKPPRVLQDKTGPSVIDAKVASLKVLALTLLKEIESMEDDSATQTGQELNLHDEVHRFEAEMIKSALTKTGGRQRRAARLLGVKVTTLNTKIKRHKIIVTESGKAPDTDPNRLVESQSEVIS